jgi:23S rRNA-/tRNA-specific pseudouridylate synthase
MFGKEREYGLVNRLDNDTAWFLYFAKTPLFYEQYKHLQSENKLQKIYIADVSGQRISNKILQQPGISGDEKTICIQRKIAHHRYDQTKMIVLPDEKFISKYQQKIRWERTTQSTRVQLMYYDEQTNTSYLKIIIHKWIRHQIRAHLASVGYPIIGDSIYNKKNPEENLHLRSLGLYI